MRAWNFHKTMASGLLALLGAMLCMGAAAQEFPTKPIRLIVPYAGGGAPVDPMTRIIAQSMSGTLGQTVVVDNRVGAGGLLAVQELLRLPADGYTLLCTDPAQWAILPALRPGVYDPLKDFAPIGMALRSILYVVVREDLNVKTIEDLVALAKAKPRTLSYGSPGIGTLHNLFMEALKAQYGIDIVHVPFKGSVPAFEALLAGDLPISVAAIATAEQQVKAGKIRRLLASASQRSRYVPDVPSLADKKIDENFTGDIGYMAAGGTPRPIIDKLAAALQKATQAPDFAQRAAGYFAEVAYRTPEQLTEIMRADGPRYVRAVKLSGAKAE